MSGGIDLLNASVPSAKARRTSGNLTLNSTTWANVDTGVDVTIPAMVGDQLLVGVSFSIRPSTTALGFSLDAATIVAGSPVNYIGTAGGAGDFGVSGWYREAPTVNDANVSGDARPYTVVSGDIVNGNVTLRLRYKTSAGSWTGYAGATLPLDFWVKNLGPANGAVAQLSNVTPSPDDLPASPHADNYEFNGSTSSLPSGWSWVNQGSTTYVEANGWGTLTVPASGSSSLRCLVRSAPVGAFTMTGKISSITSGAAAGGVYAIIMRDSSSGKILSVGCNMGTANSPINAYRWNSATSWNGEAAAVGGEMWRGGILYFRFRRNSNTSYDAYFSRDGAGWFPIIAAWDPSAFVASIDQIGFFGNSENGVVNVTSIDWLRVTS